MTTCPFCRTPLVPMAAHCSACGRVVATDGADLPLGDVLIEASRLLTEGEVDRAITLIEPHAHAREPEPRAVFALGTAYLQRGRYADALPLLAFAVEHDPHHAHAHAYLGMAYLHTYQPVEARAALDEALALAPDDFVVNLKYGELLARLGYFRESISSLDRALAVPSPDAASLAFARRLQLYARQRAVNTFTRPVGRFPAVKRLFRRNRREPAMSHT